MKYYRVKKRKGRVPVIVKEIIGPLPKPKFPLKLFTHVHKPERNIEFVFKW